MAYDNDDSRIDVIEADSLLRRARSVIPNVRTRAIESLEVKILLAKATGNVKGLAVYEKALKEAQSA